MKLSKRKTEQIGKDADLYYDGWGDGDDKTAFRTGAEMEAVKAKTLISALRKIINVKAYGYNSGTVQEIAKQALRKYKP